MSEKSTTRSLVSVSCKRQATMLQKVTNVMQLLYNEACSDPQTASVIDHCNWTMSELLKTAFNCKPLNQRVDNLMCFSSDSSCSSTFQSSHTDKNKRYSIWNEMKIPTVTNNYSYVGGDRRVFLHALILATQQIVFALRFPNSKNVHPTA